MSEIIDTPAEGFPLPTMTPPTRTLRDVAARLTPGGRARAMQRADVIGRAAVPSVAAAYRGAMRHEQEEVMHVNMPCTLVPTDVTTAIPLFPDTSVDGIVKSVLTGEIDRRLAGNLDALAERVTRGDMDDQLIAWAEADASTGTPAPLSFADGRAYERGAALRRNVGAKSLGSRRVHAQGVASDYLRDDPQDGARHAALVLAGFMGQDPETVR